MNQIVPEWSVVFEGPPDDSQLVCLLGNGGAGPVEGIEESQSLTLRPKLIPMRYMAPWMVLVMVGITCLVCFMPWGMGNRFSSILFWLFLGFGWLLVLPGTLAGFTVINRMMAKDGDYFHVDMVRHTLEVRQLGRTFAAGEIRAVTLLTRWHRQTKYYQTGILVGTKDGRVELCRVVCETGENVPAAQQSRWADRLATLFQVPLRRVELSRSESRTLGDNQL